MVDDFLDLFGPRDSVIAHLLGRPHDFLHDLSPWILTRDARRELDEYERYSQTHDYVHIDD